MFTTFAIQKSMCRNWKGFNKRLDSQWKPDQNAQNLICTWAKKINFPSIQLLLRPIPHFPGGNKIDMKIKNNLNSILLKLVNSIVILKLIWLKYPGLICSKLISKITHVRTRPCPFIFCQYWI